MDSHIIKHNKIKKFIFAGNSYFTVVNKKTGNKLVFHIIQPKDKSPWFVHATNKKDKYCYLGTIFRGGKDRFLYCWGWRHGKFTENSIVNKSFKYLFKKIFSDSLPESIIFYHNSRCGKCGKRLIDPKSIRKGFGPRCLRILVRRWRAMDKKIRDI